MSAPTQSRSRLGRPDELPPLQPAPGRVCRACGLGPDRVKFGKEARNRDGLAARCQPCESARKRAWAVANPEKNKESANRCAFNAYHRDPEKFKKARTARLDAHPERRQAYNAHTAALRRTLRKNPQISEALSERDRARRRNADELIKIRAREKVRAAVRYGKLKRDACEKCGRKDTHGHHDDYSKPLEVRWLCPVHHGEEHRGDR